MRRASMFLAVLSCGVLSAIGCQKDTAATGGGSDPPSDVADGGSARGSTPAPLNGSGLTLSRLMPDQVNTVFGQVFRGADGGTPITSRNDLLAHGGLPFPAREVAPNFRVPLMLVSLASHAFDNEFCSKALSHLALMSNEASRENVRSLAMFLWGEEPSEEHYTALERIANSSLAPSKGAGPATPPGGLMLVCAAMVQDNRFATY